MHAAVVQVLAPALQSASLWQVWTVTNEVWPAEHFSSVGPVQRYSPSLQAAHWSPLPSRHSSALSQDASVVVLTRIRAALHTLRARADDAARSLAKAIRDRGCTTFGVRRGQRRVAQLPVGALRGLVPGAACALDDARLCRARACKAAVRGAGRADRGAARATGGVASRADAPSAAGARGPVQSGARIACRSARAGGALRFQRAHRPGAAARQKQTKQDGARSPHE